MARNSRTFRLTSLWSASPAGPTSWKGKSRRVPPGAGGRRSSGGVKRGWQSTNDCKRCADSSSCREESHGSTPALPARGHSPPGESFRPEHFLHRGSRQSSSLTLSFWLASGFFKPCAGTELPAAAGGMRLHLWSIVAVPDVGVVFDSDGERAGGGCGSQPRPRRRQRCRCSSRRASSRLVWHAVLHLNTMPQNDKEASGCSAGIF